LCKKPRGFSKTSFGGLAAKGYFIERLSHNSFGGLRRQRIFFRALISLILLRKINEISALKKFYFAAAGGKILV
jgi:hypothetical protein